MLLILSRIVLSAIVAAGAVDAAHAQGASMQGAIPDGFRGKVTYKGTYTAEATRARGRNQVSKESAGAITLNLEFKGPAITGSYQTTGPLQPNRISGVVQGGVCKLYDRSEMVVEGPCTFDSFNGTMRQQRGTSALEVDFKASGAEVVDYAARDAERQQQAQQQAAEAQARKDDEARRFRAMLAEAEGGSRQAQMDVAMAYENGTGTARNQAEAHRWGMMSARQGWPRAQTFVGLNYDKGVGVDQNRAEAVRWYRAAAQQGFPLAQLLLGEKYSRGEGVVEDFERAYMWLTLASASGETSDQARDGAARLRRVLDERMTASQISQAQAAAKKCQQQQFKGCEKASAN